MQKPLTLAPIIWAICFFLVTEEAKSQSTYPVRRQMECRGWTLHVSEELFQKDAELLSQAIELLEKQLEDIIREVPEPAVLELKKVPLWISAEYPNTHPGAEYHPDAIWLKDHGRDPAMAKGVEFSNVRIFAEETRRMPNFALHELAHAYHDRVLPEGFGNASIRQAYEKAKGSGAYDSVEQRFGDGRSQQTKSYAMTTPQEYFAEGTEAYFSTNDFYPFTREQLRRHDAEFADLLTELWGVVDKGPAPMLESMGDWKHSGSIWINTTADRYAEFAKLLLPLVEQRIYGVTPTEDRNSPNLIRARWSPVHSRSIELEFDSEMTWNARCVDPFFLGGERLGIESGFAEGNQITLRCKTTLPREEGAPLLLTYVHGDSWRQKGLLRGRNRIAAFSFCDVPIGDP